MKILVTGGAGYIGRTVCSALEDNGHVPVILDSLVTGKIEFTEGKLFYQGDISDKQLLQRIFQEHPDIKYAIHFAALVVVPDSVSNPYSYYTENVGKSVEFFNNLKDLGCKNIVFSSSASIYNDAPDFIVSEQSPLRPSSPYARTKYMMEMVLEDFCFAYGLRGIALRYFNPIGADPKLRSGSHIQFPSHVLGKLLSATATATVSADDDSASNAGVFQLTGVTWPTRDGSGIRDFVHVWDLALAHVKAIENFEKAFERSDNDGYPYLVINLGTGSGVTVKELVKAFEKVHGKPVNQIEAEPRPGDVAGSYANAARALQLIDWKAEKSVEDGIRDALRWDEVRENIIHY